MPKIPAFTTDEKFAIAFGAIRNKNTKPITQFPDDWM